METLPWGSISDKESCVKCTQIFAWETYSHCQVTQRAGTQRLGTQRAGTQRCGIIITMWNDYETTVLVSLLIAIIM
jgi:hypothetical protein